MQRADGPAFTIDSGNEKGGGFLQGTELAARVVSAFALLPTEVGTLVGGFVTLSTAAQFAWDQLGALVATADTPPGQSRADSAVASSPINDREKKKKTTQPIRQRTSSPATAPVCTGQLTKTAVALGVLSSLTAVDAATASDSKTLRWIEVADAETLGKIGRDPAYPLDGHYRQFADIDAGNLSGPIGNASHPFVGKYDGRGQSIDKLRHCFVQRLGDNGRIDNVRFVRADISSREMAGVVACKLTGGATLGNIEVEHSTVVTNGGYTPAGIGAGAVYDHARIDGFSTFNCTTKTTGRISAAGAVAGVVRGLINNTRLENASIETFHVDSHAGGGAGKLYGMIGNTVMIDSKIVTHGTHAHAGGAAGKATLGACIGNTVLVSTDLITNDDQSCAAGGAGEAEFATIANTLLVHSNLRTHGHRAHAAGGSGIVSMSGRIINTTMVYGKAETSGWQAHAAVGVGFLFRSGQVYNSTGRQVLIRTARGESYGAVGAGRASGEVVGVVCFGSNVTTTRSNSAAGIGAGKLSGHAVDVVAYDCRVGATGRRSVAGFGSGLIMPPDGRFLNLTVMHSRAYASGRRSYAVINWGSSPFVCSSSVGKYKSPPCCSSSTEKSCLPIPEDACKLADRRLVTPDCRPASTGYDFKALASENINQFDLCPVAPKGLSKVSSPTPPTVTDQIIEVNNVATLRKIGTDPNYPLSASYIQTSDIDASSLSRPISHFTGQYNGQHHSITNLACCLVGSLEGHGSIGNLHFTGARINASRPAGVVACGVIGNGTIHDILVEHSLVMTSGNDADAGIGAGVLLGGSLVNTTTINSTVITFGKGADAGIGSGSIGNGAEIFLTTSLHSRVETAGNNANAAIGAGTMNNGASATGTSGVNSQVETSGDEANAGIGGGSITHGATLLDTMSQGSRVITSGNAANAGIGAGRMGRDTVAKDTLAQDSQVSTSGDEASAGIGVGVVDHRARIVGIRSDRSKVETSGDRANAGIGAGTIRGNGTVTDTWAVNSTAIASGNEASADIGAGRIEAGGLVINTTEVGSFARATGYSSPMAPEPAVVPATPAPVTETVATVADTTMTFSGLPGATMALPPGVAPMAASLSTSAIAGIALGAVAFVLAGVAGVCIYRHYHRRPSPADAYDPQELVVIDTVGKTQEVRGQPR